MPASLAGPPWEPDRIFGVHDLPMIRPGAWLVCFSILASCRPHVGTRAEWLRWFDATAAQLPKWDAPPPHMDWPRVQTDDHIALRLDAGYRKRNWFCWDKGKLPPRTTAWRDLCVHLVQPELQVRPDFFLKPGPHDPNLSDHYQFEDWQVGAVTIAGRRAIVERARVSGGIEGARRERRTVVLLEYRHGEWVMLDGSSGDDAGCDELLGISGSIEPS